jgi:hypothetical protein
MNGFTRFDPAADRRPVILIENDELDRGTRLWLLALGFGLGAIWIGFVWAIWAVCF